MPKQEPGAVFLFTRRTSDNDSDEERRRRCKRWTEVHNKRCHVIHCKMLEGYGHEERNFQLQKKPV